MLYLPHDEIPTATIASTLRACETDVAAWSSTAFPCAGAGFSFFLSRLGKAVTQRLAWWIIAVTRVPPGGSKPESSTNPISSGGNWSRSSARPRSQGPWPRFLQSGVEILGACRGSQRHSESLTGRRSSAWGVAEYGVGERRSPCQRLPASAQDTNRVRPLLTATAVTRPSRSQPRRQAWSLNTSHLSSARVGSRRAFSRERQFDEDHGEVVAGLVGLAEDETDFRIVITRPPAPSEKAAAQQQYGALAHNPLFEECRALQAAAEERERYSGIRKPRS